MGILHRELRIGNYVKSVRTGEVIEVDWIAIKHVYDGNVLPPAHGMGSAYEPIPMTEELLLKCGFSWLKQYKAYTNDVINGEISLNSKETENYALHILNTKDFGGTIPSTYYDGKFYLTSEAEYLVSTKPIQFLHQLQNLYFALTGEELEVKI